MSTNVITLTMDLRELPLVEAWPCDVCGTPMPAGYWALVIRQYCVCGGTCASPLLTTAQVYRQLIDAKVRRGIVLIEETRTMTGPHERPRAEEMLLAADALALEADELEQKAKAYERLTIEIRMRRAFSADTRTGP